MNLKFAFCIFQRQAHVVAAVVAGVENTEQQPRLNVQTIHNSVIHG